MTFKPVALKPAPQRHRRIGGTELGILCGISSFGSTPFDVWNRIVNGISTFKGNVYSDRGNAYEPVVRIQYVNKTGAILAPHPGMILFEECFACSLDDLASRDAAPLFPVDYKTASINSIKKWGPDGSSLFPENYAMQLRLYMAATNSDRAELFAAFGVDEKHCSPCRAAGIPSCDHANAFHSGGFSIKETRLYRLERDLKIERQALDTGRKFWQQFVVPRIPPER